MSSEEIPVMCEKLTRIMSTEIMSADLVDRFLQLLQDVGNREMWSDDDVGCKFVQHCVDEFERFLSQLQRQGAYHLFELSFSRFTASMSTFLVMWKTNYWNSNLAKAIAYTWINCVPMSTDLRWTAIKENLGHIRTLFGILRNVGNLFAQMDICELLMRYFYQLNRHFNVKSLFESSDDGWTVNGDVQMLCNFFNTMIDNMDLQAVQFLNNFNKRTSVLRVATFVARRIYLNSKECPVKIPSTNEKPVDFHVNFNLGSPLSVSFYAAISTFDPSAADGFAWFPCEVFVGSIRKAVYCVQPTEFAINIKLNKIVELYPNFKCRNFVMVFGSECLDDMRENVFAEFHVMMKQNPGGAEWSFRSSISAGSTLGPGASFQRNPQLPFPPSTPPTTTTTKQQLPHPSTTVTIHSKISDPTIDEVCQAFDELNPSQEDHQPINIKTPPYTGTTLPLPISGLLPKHIQTPPITGTTQQFSSGLAAQRNPDTQMSSSTHKNPSTHSTPTGSLRRSVRSVQVMQQIRHTRNSISSELPATDPTTDPYHLDNLINDDPPPASKRSVPNSRAKPKPKPTIRANARFKNPYLRFKKTHQAINNTDMDDNKRVNFSYRRKNNSQLGYTTQEVSIQFCDVVQPAATSPVTTKTTTRMTKRQMAAAAKKAAAAAAAATEGKKGKKLEKTKEVNTKVQAKRVSVAQTKEVIKVNTPQSATVAQTDTRTETVSTLHIESRAAPQPAAPTIDLDTSDSSPVAPLSTLRSQMRSIYMNDGGGSSSDFSLPAEWQQPRKPRTKTFDYLNPSATKKGKKKKEATRVPEPPAVVTTCMMAAIPQPSSGPTQIQRTTTLDLCRNTHQGDANISIPSIGQQANMSIGRSTPIRPTRSASLLIPDETPTPLHSSINSLDHAVSRIVRQRSNSSSSSIADTPQRPSLPRKSYDAASVPRRSILKKTTPRTQHPPPSTNDVTLKELAIKRIAQEAELVKISPKRGRSSMTAPQMANMREYTRNWVLRNFVETMDLGNADGGVSEEAGFDRTIDSVDRFSPVRANMGSEPLQWQSPASSSSKENHEPEIVSRQTPAVENSTSKRPRRVSFHMDTTPAVEQVIVEPPTEADPTLSQLIANAMPSNRGQLMAELQEQIDEFRHELSDLVEQGVKRLEANEDRRAAIERHIGELQIALEQQRLAHEAAVNDSSECCSNILDKMSALNERLTDVNDRANQTRSEIQRQTELFGRTVWKAAVQKTSRELRSVLDLMGSDL